MRSMTCSVFDSLVFLALMQAVPALSADVESDALSLEAAPEARDEGAPNTKIFIEGAVGNASQRYLPDSRDTARASFDFFHSAGLGSGLRAVFSARIEHLYPRDAGADEPVKTLRGASWSWQPDGRARGREFGRLHMR